MKKSLILLGLLAAVSVASAKLPAPPPATPEAQAKAAEAAARAAWAGKVDAYQLCRAQERVAAHVQAGLAAAGKQAPTPVSTPPCADPGPFAFVPPAPSQ
jgi:hypothetical protein